MSIVVQNFVFTCYCWRDFEFGLYCTPIWHCTEVFFSGEGLDGCGTSRYPVVFIQSLQLVPYEINYILSTESVSYEIQCPG